MTVPLRPAVLTLLALCIATALPARRAEACSRAYIVLFDQRSTVIPERGGLILAEFARDFLTREQPDPQGPVRLCPGLPPGDFKVVILAHADDPGTRDQCALSFARGHAVRAHLASLGIPESSMAVVAFGDGARLVPNQPGDPQNRRVQVIPVDGNEVAQGDGPYPRFTPRSPRWDRWLPRSSCP
jgi:outer membrane protein OmpA-like peptidoglycan-associated protein